MDWTYAEATEWIEAHGGHVVCSPLPTGLRIVVRVNNTATAVAVEPGLLSESDIRREIVRLAEFVCEQLYPTR